MGSTNIVTVHTITSGLVSMSERSASRSTSYHSMFQKCESFLLHVSASRDTDHRRRPEDRWRKGMKSRDKKVRKRPIKDSKRAVYVSESTEYTRVKATIAHDGRSVQVHATAISYRRACMPYPKYGENNLFVLVRKSFPSI